MPDYCSRPTTRKSSTSETTLLLRKGPGTRWGQRKTSASSPSGQSDGGLLLSASSGLKEKSGRTGAGLAKWLGPRDRARVELTRLGHPSLNVLTVSGLLAKLDHCVIHVSDWAVSNPFYRDVLGAELIDRGNGTWAYRFGTEQLNVHGPGAIGDPVAKLPVAPGNSDLCFEWDGLIQDAVEHLKGHGVEIEVGPAERNGARGRGTSVYFRDPDGSLLEFISYRS